MSEFGEHHGPRPFETLSPVDKVRAMLATSPKPLSREFTLELVGLVPQEMSEDDQQAINELFLSDEVVKQETEEGDRFTLGETGRAMLGEIDQGSVYQRMKENLWDPLFEDEEP